MFVFQERHLCRRIGWRSVSPLCFVLSHPPRHRRALIAPPPHQYTASPIHTTCSITDATVAALAAGAAAASLEALNLTGTGVSDGCLETLATGLPALAAVALSGTRVTRGGAEALAARCAAGTAAGGSGNGGGASGGLLVKYSPPKAPLPPPAFGAA